MITQNDILQRYYSNLPSYLRPEGNRLINSLLRAWAGEDARIENAIDEARDQLFIATADGYYLNLLGANLGIARPEGFVLDDEKFRNLIPILSSGQLLNKAVIADLIDLIYGPAYQRANCTSQNSETYRMAKAIDLLTDGTMVGTFTVSTIADLAVGYEIELTDDVTPLASYTITNITGAGPYTIELDGGLSDISAYLVAQNAQVRTSESLTVQTDTGTETVRFLTSDFVDSDNATADEIATAYNARMHLSVADALITNTGTYVRVRTKTIGALGSIHVLSGTANNSLNFDTDQPCKNANIFIVENGNKDGVEIVTNTDVPLLNRELSGAWYLRSDHTIVDGRPNVTSANPFYPGAFLASPASNKFITSVKTTLQETINIGDYKNTVQFSDVSSFPDDSLNTITFGFGLGDKEEGPIRYNSRPINTVLTFNPAISFQKAHAIGDEINLSTAPTGTGVEDYGLAFQGYKPRDDGLDYMAFVTNPLTAQEILEELILQVTGAGIPVTFDVQSLVYRWAEL